MKREWWTRIRLVGLMMGAFSILAPQVEKQASSTMSDQTEVSVTVYNDNLALIKDSRQVLLPEGTFHFRFEDVASQIDPTSLSILSLTDPGNFQVLEQNYEYDLINPQKLLSKYLGKIIYLSIKDKEGKEQLVEATLLSAEGGGVYQIGDKIYLGSEGRVVLPELPEGLISKPTLIWLLNTRKSARHTLQASYLTQGMQWKADYVSILNEKDDRLDLTGWVTIENHSGATYTDASLKLVAGTVHRVPPPYPKYEYAAAEMRAPGAAPPQFREEAFFEYHLYTLERRTTLHDNETKQMTLLEASSVPVQKKFQLEGQRFWFTSRMSEKQEQKVGVYLELENAKKNNMGIPLPKGTFRVYKKDSSGAIQFIGEDSIDHTPRDEMIRVKIGEAFDIAADRVQTDYKIIAPGVYEVAFDIQVRNHKNDDVIVEALEPVWGDWQILSSTFEPRKVSASFVKFLIPVQANGKSTLSYRVRIHSY